MKSILSDFRKQLAVLALLLFVSSGASPACSDELIRPEQVLSVVTADWNGDGSFDRAVLIASNLEPGSTELLIYLSEPKTETMKLTLRKLNPAWMGDMWGTLPRLNLDKNNNLVIHSQNDVIGRNRWQRMVTINYDSGHFFVSGYSLSEQDTLDPDYNFSCTFNMFTGHGKKNNTPFTVKAQTLILANWTDEWTPSPCDKRTQQAGADLEATHNLTETLD